MATSKAKKSTTTATDVAGPTDKDIELAYGINAIWEQVSKAYRVVDTEATGKAFNPLVKRGTKNYNPQPPKNGVAATAWDNHRAWMIIKDAMQAGPCSLLTLNELCRELNGGQPSMATWRYKQPENLVATEGDQVSAMAIATKLAQLKWKPIPLRVK